VNEVAPHLEEEEGEEEEEEEEDSKAIHSSPHSRVILDGSTV